MGRPEALDRSHYLHRILLVAVGLTVLYGLIVARLYYLQTAQHDYYAKRAQRHHTRTVKITPLRGGIYSSSGAPLATSVYRESAYLASRYIPEDAKLRRRLALELAQCLDMSVERVAEKIATSGDVVLKRKLLPETVAQLNSIRESLQLPRPALYFVKEGKRFYPKEKLASHVVGFTRQDDFGDNIGVNGVESEENTRMAGSYVKEKVEATVLGQALSPVQEEAFLEATGNDVYLTIHEAIQHYAEEALAHQVEKHEARGGVCVVMEVDTGAVLAMASYPDFDLNAPGRYPGSHRTNRCLVHSIPPGSVMKVFTTAALVENNLVSPYEMIDCENGHTVFRDSRDRAIRTIRDSHRSGIVPVHQAFAESSNVAYTKLGLRMEGDVYYEHLRRFGFGQLTGIDLPGENQGIMHPYSRWTLQSRISLAIGYEITVTPVQMTAAMAALANGGVYMRPFVVREVRSPQNETLFRKDPERVRRVCSPQTSRIVLSMMEEVVHEEYGTGHQAAIPGYRIGGKTGTTRKHHGSADDPDKPAYWASFIGVLPVNNPRLVIYSWVDEPNVQWGGTVAAPIFRMVGEHAVRILGIPASEPVQPARLAHYAKSVSSDTPPQATPLLPGSPETGKALMPDLRGLTMREAAEALYRLGIEAEMVGTGYVVQQQPPPHSPLGPHEKSLLVFGRHMGDASPGEDDEPTL